MPKQVLHVSATEMVYGQPLVVPGKCRTTRCVVSTAVYTMPVNTSELHGSIHPSRTVYVRSRVHASGFRETCSSISIEGTLASP